MGKFKLDVTTEHCPMTYVRTKIQLAKLAKGDLLEVLVKGQEPVENIPLSATEQGYNVVSVAETAESGVYQIIIER